MRLIRKASEIRRQVASARTQGKAVGLVPTMGYLHEGHLSLIRQSAAENGLTVTSLYVNPLQFAPGEDLERYPRDLAADQALCEAAGSDILFAPADAEVYPEGVDRHLTVVSVRPLSGLLCGRTRPTHFDGVSTVVAKLLNLVAPDRAYFGQKDYQQALIIKTMVRDLNFPVAVRVCPTVREADGLAMSSRNAYLTPEERAQAPVLQRALQSAARLIEAGERDGAEVAAYMAREIGQAPLARLDYASVVDPGTLRPAGRIEGRVLLAVACYFGKARLIDNLLVDPPVKGKGPPG